VKGGRGSDYAHHGRKRLNSGLKVSPPSLLGSSSPSSSYGIQNVVIPIYGGDVKWPGGTPGAIGAHILREEKTAGIYTVEKDRNGNLYHIRGSYRFLLAYPIDPKWEVMMTDDDDDDDNVMIDLE